MPTTTRLSKIVDADGHAYKLVYDAVEDKKRRRPASGILQSEDRDLNAANRRNAISATRDLVKNFSLARWAINKHLDFVSTFSFRSKNKDEALDRRIDELIEWRSRPTNFDVAARHSRAGATRLAEARRTIDGDVFALKLASGQVQWIEGDRVRTPYHLPAGIRANLSDMEHGVLTNAAGRALAYCVCRRGKKGSGFEVERLVSSRNLLHHAHFDRFDQVRGISPLLSAYNSFQDVYENISYALLKSKVAQLFGMVVTRDGDDPLGTITNSADDGDDTTETDTERGRYEIDFGQGPFFQELDRGDDMKFLENKTPSAEFQQFMVVAITLALKSIDIPYSWYDEAWTNFFGNKIALALYLMSCIEKRRCNQQLLRAWTIWQLAMWILDGTLVLPGSMELTDLKFEWIPAGMPWWDQSKEVAGDVAAIGAGLRSRTEIRKERYGDEWRDVIDTLSEEEKYIIEKEVHLAEPAINVTVGVGSNGEDDAKRASK